MKRNRFVSSNFTTSTGDRMTHRPKPTATRPRVEGDREDEILDADARGARRRRLRPAHHGRRRRSGHGPPRPRSTAAGTPSSALVVDAMLRSKGADVVPDTGIAARRPGRDLLRHRRHDRDAVATAVLGQRDHRHRPRPGVRRAFRERVHRPQGRAPPARSTSAPVERGEVRADVDLDLIAPPSPGSCSTAPSCSASSPTRRPIARVIDQIILPAVAATRDRRPHHELQRRTQ